MQLNRFPEVIRKAAAEYEPHTLAFYLRDGLADAFHSYYNAHKFIDFILEPKIIAAITTAVGYANAVPASRAFTPAEIVNDPVVYPPADAKLSMPVLETSKYERERNRLWTRIKTGR